MKINILRANKTDLEQILLLQKEAYLSEAEIYDDYSIPPLVQTIHTLEKEFEESIFLKTEFEGEIIGSIRGSAIGTNCYVGKLIVKKNHQNKGIGKLLLSSIELAYPNCHRFELFTGNKSVKNLHLYNKFGYNEFKRAILNDNLSMVYLEKFVNK